MPLTLVLSSVPPRTFTPLSQWNICKKNILTLFTCITRLLHHLVHQLGHNSIQAAPLQVHQKVRFISHLIHNEYSPLPQATTPSGILPRQMPISTTAAALLTSGQNTTPNQINYRATPLLISSPSPIITLTANNPPTIGISHQATSSPHQTNISTPTIIIPTQPLSSSVSHRNSPLPPWIPASAPP